MNEHGLSGINIKCCGDLMTCTAHSIEYPQRMRSLAEDVFGNQAERKPAAVVATSYICQMCRSEFETKHTEMPPMSMFPAHKSGLSIEIAPPADAALTDEQLRAVAREVDVRGRVGSRR